MEKHGESNWLSRWFSPRGRIERRTWWLRVCGILALWSGPVFVGNLMVGLLWVIGEFNWHQYRRWGRIVEYSAWASWVVALWCCAARCAKRLSDQDRSPWCLLSGFIPIVGWVVLVVIVARCGFIAGESRHAA